MFFHLFLKSRKSFKFIFCNFTFTLIIFLQAFKCCVSFTNTRVPTRDEIKNWATNLEIRLIGELENISGIHILEDSFSKDINQHATVVEVDGQKLVREMSEALNKNFNRKKKALTRLVDVAEDLVRNYKDQALKLDDVKWANVKYLNEDPKTEVNLTYSPKFKRGINESFSGVHIPLEIYEGYTEILNGLKWSSKLDETFINNSKEDPTLLWQYFGSHTGFMRQFPASKWNTIDNYPDLYDVRRRPWYIHGSSSPKDMLILMDTSGSMHGQTMEIMKNSVKNILDTLGEDDFVNVAKFSNETNWVSCFQTFVQATWRNKYTLIKEIDNLKDSQMASLAKALNFSFSQFDKFDEHRQREGKWIGADCNKIIVIFTDGGTEVVGDVIKKWNRDKRYRIFTFAVGPHPVPYATLKQVACKNKGFFSSIPSMGATRTRVQDYVKVLSRPMVLSKEHEFQWTNFYRDVFGLGVLTTVTLPVFNTSNDEQNKNQSIVGVMGIDITVQELVDQEPSYKLGPGGYSFALNHNGLVVFHPDLPTEVTRPPMPTQITAFDDSPHVDFLEVEAENSERENIRKAMINQQSGTKTVRGIIKMSDSIHAVVQSLTYYYTSVEKTSFSLALVVHSKHTHYLEIKGYNLKKGVDVQAAELNKLILAPWKYCNNTVILEISILNAAMKNYVETCNEVLVKRLMFDIDRSRPIIKYWEDQQNSGKRQHVIYTFVTTEGGLSRVYPYEETATFKPKADPKKAHYYQRAVYSNGWVFLVPEIDDGLPMNETQTNMKFAKMLVLNYPSRGVLYKPAVVGGVIKSDLIKNLLMTTPNDNELSKYHCGQHNDEQKQVLCYLVDDGGYIIITNQKDDDFMPGKFLGSVDAELMQDLVNNSIFKQLKETDHEELCEKVKKVNASPSAHSNNLFKVIYQVFSTFEFSNIFWNIYYFLTTFSIWSPSSRALPDFSINSDDVEVCSKVSARYYVENPVSYAGYFICDEKNERVRRNYSLATLGEGFATNLMLIVTTPQTHCHVPELVQQPRKVEQIDICTPNVRYRRRPGKCFANHSQEYTLDCGQGNVIKFSFYLLGLEITTLLVSRKWLF